MNEPSYSDVADFEPRWTEENVIELWNKGETPGAIEGALGVSSATVHKIARKALADGRTTRKIKRYKRWSGTI